ncbi:ABC transporter ATP-binding protein [Tuberibacillus sp. Marseille-P3662]|uniref:ABC transporter ATP-binding protein n=1 Tax=Tuberibacillus sp. Marseille-P3662 TaxID=1965358 RepID=UPI000A1CAF48|nr:ABC transporter ATP-binding protein [Tuberibacillus sp. Marseille-P3662]
MLNVHQLTKVYQGQVSNQALDHVSFYIEAGEFVGVMGPSGSGKTTLLNMIATIDRPSSGEVLIDEEHPYRLKKNDLAKFRRRELGFVFQDFNLLDTLTVKENIVLPLTLEGVDVNEMNDKVTHMAQRLGIEAILDKRTYEISGGQAQRTAIARAMIHSPKLLLADEPTGNLDSKSSKEVMENLTSINKNDDATIMMVTHDPQVASYCDRVIFIKDGALYNEIERGGNRKTYHQRILDMLLLLGGEIHP